MIERVFELHNSGYSTQEICTSICMNAGMDEFISIGHDSHNSNWNRVRRFKLIETIGEETHIHLAVNIGDSIDDGQLRDMHIIRTKIITENDPYIRVLNYTAPIIKMLSQLTNHDPYRHTLMPIQSVILKRLLYDLINHFCAQHEVAESVREFVRKYTKTIFHTLPPTIHHTTELMGSRESMYHDIVSIFSSDPTMMPELLNNNFIFNTLKYPFGLAGSLAYGEAVDLKIFEKSIEQSPKIPLFDKEESHPLIMNPHLFTDKDHDANYDNRYMREAYFHLIDLVTHTKLEEFSVTYDMLQYSKVCINFYRDGYSTDRFDTRYECTPKDIQYKVLGLSYEDIILVLQHLAEGVPEIPSTTAVLSEYKITVCKTFNELIVIRFEFKHGGIETCIFHYLDMVLSYIMTPAVLCEPR